MPWKEGMFKKGVYLLNHCTHQAWSPPGIYSGLQNTWMITFSFSSLIMSYMTRPDAYVSGSGFSVSLQSGQVVRLQLEKTWIFISENKKVMMQPALETRNPSVSRACGVRPHQTFWPLQTRMEVIGHWSSSESCCSTLDQYNFTIAVSQVYLVA